MKHNLKKNTRWLYFLAAFGLALATILVYVPSLRYPFQFDDLGSIIQFFGIRNQTFHDLFFSGSRWISYWLNTVHYHIGAFDPFSYRVGNLIIHLCNGLLIFFILLITLKAPTAKLSSPNPKTLKPTALNNCISASWFNNNAFYISLTTSLLFLLHPVQTQTVSYVIQGQLEGLATLCILSMVLSLIFFVRAQSPLTTLCSTLTLCFFAALSTGTKEIAIISPLLLLLVDWFFLAKGSYKKIVSRWWLYALVTAIVIGCYLYFLKPAFFIEILGFHKVIRNNTGNVVTQDPHQMIGPWIYFISEFKAIVHYIWMFIWPFNISVEYDDMLCRGFFSLDCLAPLAVLAALAGSTIALLRKNSTHLIAFGMLWFALCIAPRSTFIPSNELIVDYKTYMASFGWLLVIAIAFVFFIHTVTHFLQVRFSGHPGNSHIQPLWIFFASTFMLTTALGYATLQRNTVWSSGLNFWQNIVANAPQKARVQNNYGVELSSIGNHKEAVRHLKKAIDLDSHYADPYNNLATLFAKLNLPQEAILCLKKGLRINPQCHEGFNNLCVAYIQQHDYVRAERCAKMAIKINPHYGQAYGSLARIYLEQDKPAIAWSYLKKACTQADLDTPIGYNAFAQVSMRLNKYDDAIWAFNKLLTLNATFPDAQLNLANAYFLSNQCRQAEEEYKKLLDGSPHDAFIYYNLGKAAYGQGNYTQAIIYYEHIPNNHPEIKDSQQLIAACLQKVAMQKRG